MRSSILSFFVVSALAISGCAVTPDQPVDEDGTAEDQGALSTWAQGLTGAYATTDKTTDFDRIVLESNGHYFSEEDVVCIKAPCNPVRVDGKWTGTKPAGSKDYGFLRLYPGGGKSYTSYRLILGSEHSSFKLSADGGKHYAKYTSTGTFCREDGDCDGQSYIRPMCAPGHAVCNATSNTCGYHCGEKPPVCDYSDTTKKYIAKDPAKCAVVRFVCEAGYEYFGGECGCGCQPVKPACKPTGCSGQVCSDKDVITTCIYRSEYACYKSATCERGTDGACGWRDTPELSACLASK